VVVGELVEGLDGAAELGGDVVQGVVPGEVFLAEPGWVKVDHAGLLAGRPAGWLGCGDGGIADWAAGPRQRVPAQHLAQVAEGGAQVRRDLEGRADLVLAMDSAVPSRLRKLAGDRARPEVRLHAEGRDVPDPWGQDAYAFSACAQLIEEAARQQAR
jgi:hypothetical protein